MSALALLPVFAISCANTAVEDNPGGTEESAEAATGPVEPDTQPSPTSDTETPSGDNEPESSDDSDAETPTAASEPGHDPEHISIPELGIDQELISLGFNEDGTMEVPTEWDDIGFFTGGGVPGGPGPTTIAGHLDSPTAPAIFYELETLESGDTVELTDTVGETHLYKVTHSEVVSKDEFPTQEVFGQTPDDELRLITCTGLFDTQAQSHEDNHIVFATAIED